MMRRAPDRPAGAADAPFALHENLRDGSLDGTHGPLTLLARQIGRAHV